MKTLLRLFGVLSVGYFLWVLLGTGYISDDAYNSMIPGSLFQGQISLWNRTTAEIIGWIRGAGRFYPLSFAYTYPLFYYVRSLAVYKVISFTVVVSSIVFFALFLARWSGSWRQGVLALFLVPVFFQFRAWHDPLLGFCFLLPLIMLYLSVAFWLFVKHLDGGNRRWFWGAVVAYSAALMTYEVSYLLCVCFTLIAWQRTQSLKKAIRASWVFLALGCGFVLLAFALKSKLNPYFNNAYLGVSIRWYFPKVYKALLIQLWAAFPLSYYLKTHTRLTGFLMWKELLFVIPYCASLYVLLKHKEQHLKLRFYVLSGLALFVIPAIPLAVSSGYQDQLIEMSWGIGYLPVYLQYFGMFLLFLALAIGFLRRMESFPRAHKISLVLLSLGFGTVAVLNLGQNRSIAYGANRVFKYPRDVLDASLLAGILDSVPEGSILIRNGRFPADHTWNFTKNTGKIWMHVEITELLQELEKRRKNPSLAPSVGWERFDSKTRLSALFPVPSTADFVSRLVAVRRGSQQSVDLRSWPIYGFTFDYDATHGKSGMVYLSRIERLEYNPSKENEYRLISRGLKAYDYSSGEIGVLGDSEQLFDFHLFINQSFAPPFTLKTFPLKNFKSRDSI